MLSMGIESGLALLNQSSRGAFTRAAEATRKTIVFLQK